MREQEKGQAGYGVRYKTNSPSLLKTRNSMRRSKLRKKRDHAEKGNIVREDLGLKNSERPGLKPVGKILPKARKKFAGLDAGKRSK